ncbi:hypothetical protein PENSPDRAFT_682375 [Peniophora sp. CONT]|nr:hypothetical protein PENSPDRAFT_682375 [Peniophora sp. CONT]
MSLPSNLAASLPSSDSSPEAYTTQAPSTTIHPPIPHLPVPFYLSSVSHFLIDHMFFTSGRIVRRLWKKHDHAFKKAHRSAFDVRKPKSLPTSEDGKRMVTRRRERSFDRANVMKDLIHKFKKPYSELKRIHGPSKLRLEITASSCTSVIHEVDFSPIRAKPFLHTSPITGEIKLHRFSRLGGLEVFARTKRVDNRDTVIRQKNDARRGESHFDAYDVSRMSRGRERKIFMFNGKLLWDDE